MTTPHTTSHTTSHTTFEEASQATSARTAEATPATPAPLKPLDARLARLLIAPLVGTRVRPSHVTALRTLLGLAACALFAVGSYATANAGAFLFIASNFIDHADGELARATGLYTKFGRAFDLASDWLIHSLLFLCLGIGLADSAGWALWLGVFCAVMIALVFTMHEAMSMRMGARDARLPAFAWFEIEDVMYLFPLVTLLSLRHAFLVAAAIGLPCFGAWLTGVFMRRWRGQG